MAVKADITIDIDKQVGELQNLSQIYNARVGDNKTPLTIAWRKNDLPLNLKGLHAYIVGKTGDGSYNNETGKIDFPVGSPVSQFEDDGSGTLDGGQSGLTTLLIPKQMWQKSGLFSGYIGLKSEDGSVFTSKDIWFKVLGNVLDAGVEINYFIGDFNKALAEAEKKLQDKEASFDQITNAALDELKQKYQQKVAAFEGSMDKTNASINEYLASMQNLTARIESLQNKLKAEDVVPYGEYLSDKQDINTKIDNKLKDLTYPLEVFTDADAISQKYPNGGTYGNRLVLAGNPLHKWFYKQDGDKMWHDLGLYETTQIADHSITGSQLKPSAANLNYFQVTPWILNWENRTLTVSNSSTLLIGNKLYGVLNSADGTHPYNIPKIDENYAIAVLFNADTLKLEFSSLGSPSDDRYYLGEIDFATKTYSIKFDMISSDQLWSEDISLANDIRSVKLPSDNSFIASGASQIRYDPQKAKLTLFGNTNIFFKKRTISLSTGEYQFPGFENKNIFFYVTYDGKIKAFSDPNDAPDNEYFIGYYDGYNCHTYFKNVGYKTALNPSLPIFLASQNKFKIDFKNKKFIAPFIDHWFNSTSCISINSQSLDLVDDTAFVGLDENNPDQPYVFSNDLFNLTFKYQLLGFYDLNHHVYYFGSYGSSNDFDSYPYWQKSISCLGDSITSGGMTSVGKPAISYVPNLQNLLHSENVTNCGVSGSGITKVVGKNDSFAERVDSIKGQDLVTVFGGINDFMYLNSPLGKMSDTSDTITTFYGALKHVFEELLKNNPDAKFLMITPYKVSKDGIGTFDKDGNLRKNDAGYTELDYVNAIKDVASYYSIPVVDMFNAGNFNLCTKVQMAMDNNAYSADLLHPNEKGAKRIAETIYHAINRL